MTDVSRWFLRTAPCWALAGMLLGIGMAASQDHRLHSVHAHINLLGWVSMFLFGLFLRAHPAAAARREARWLFWLLNAALAVMVPSLSAVMLGHPGADPIAALSGLMLIGAMILFVRIVFVATRV